MWEFSINVKDKKANEVINRSSSIFFKDLNGFFTCVNQKSTYSTVFAVEECHKTKLQVFLTKLISSIVCTFYKDAFLEEKLFIKSSENINFYAFKQALLNFDKETDYFIIQKNLNFEKNLFLESFYNFKLSSLREKWKELVSLANENREHLAHTDTFFDLLKFLIDNIDIAHEEIDVVENEDGYRVFADCEENSLDGLDEKSLISALIDLSPQKINLYCKKESKAISLLKKIYERRVNLRFENNDIKECLTFEKKSWNFLTYI